MKKTIVLVIPPVILSPMGEESLMDSSLSLS